MTPHPGEHETMKFTQIAACADEENGESLYALGEDGNIYERIGTFHAADHGVSPPKGAWFGRSWWKKVELPFEDPDPLLESTRRQL
jgi:hypothetical protein